MVDGRCLLVAVHRLGRSAGLIWLPHCRHKNDLFTKFGPGPMASTNATIRRARLWVPVNICTGYVGWRKKKTTSCGPPLNAVSTVQEFFDGMSRVSVVKVFQDALLILLSFN